MKLPQVPCCLRGLQVSQSQSSRCLWASRMPGPWECSCVREPENSSAWLRDLLPFHLRKQESKVFLTWSNSCCWCVKIETTYLCEDSPCFLIQCPPAFVSLLRVQKGALSLVLFLHQCTCSQRNPSPWVEGPIAIRVPKSVTSPSSQAL